MHSATSTSASLPVATIFEKPRPRSVAIPYAHDPNAPLCVASAIAPRRGLAPSSSVEKVACRPLTMFRRPRELGPMRRTAAPRQSATISSCIARPSSSSSAKPAVNTWMQRTPLAMQSRTAAATAGAGTQTIAWSTAAGTSTMLVYAGKPCTSPPFLLTA
jgi:hypothetical protein